MERPMDGDLLSRLIACQKAGDALPAEWVGPALEVVQAAGRWVDSLPRPERDRDGIDEIGLVTRAIVRDALVHSVRRYIPRRSDHPDAAPGVGKDVPADLHDLVPRVEVQVRADSDDDSLTTNRVVLVGDNGMHVLIAQCSTRRTALIAAQMTGSMIGWPVVIATKTGNGPWSMELNSIDAGRQAGE